MEGFGDGQTPRLPNRRIQNRHRRIGKLASGARWDYLMTTHAVPGNEWARGSASPELTAAVNDLCIDDQLGVTLACVVIHHGVVVAERYFPDTTPNVFRQDPAPETTAETTFISWSMAKSLTHALVGLCVEDGLLSVSDPVGLASWAGTDKETITLQHLLNMRSGLGFVEDYVDDQVSHVIEMLFGRGTDDVATFAADLPLIHAPGDHWNYSSGDTNILARCVGEAVGPSTMCAYIQDRLFDAIGMSSATAKFDAAGTFIGSSYVYATALDFARFGLLYLNDGWWGERRLLPAGWVDHARTPTPVPPTEEHGYGAHWWLWPYEQSLACHGYEGQRMIVLPDRDAVIVRLGKTNESQNELLRHRLHALIRAIPTS